MVEITEIVIPIRPHNQILGIISKITSAPAARLSVRIVVGTSENEDVHRTVSIIASSVIVGLQFELLSETEKLAGESLRIFVDNVEIMPFF